MNDKKEKHREFWVNDNAEGDNTFTVSRTPWFGSIHVIEYSAVKNLESKTELLQSEILKLKSELLAEKERADQLTGFKEGYWSNGYEAGIKERDQVFADAEKLVEALKFIVDINNLSFAECSTAEAIYKKCKEAIEEWSIKHGK